MTSKNFHKLVEEKRREFWNNEAKDIERDCIFGIDPATKNSEDCSCIIECEITEGEIKVIKTDKWSKHEKS